MHFYAMMRHLLAVGQNEHPGSVQTSPGNLAPLQPISSSFLPGEWSLVSYNDKLYNFFAIFRYFQVNSSHQNLLKMWQKKCQWVGSKSYIFTYMIKCP